MKPSAKTFPLCLSPCEGHSGDASRNQKVIDMSGTHVSSPFPSVRASVHSAPRRSPSHAGNLSTSIHDPPPRALTLHLTLAVLAAAAVWRAAQDTNTNAERVSGKAVLAVLLARNIASAVAALFEEGRILSGGSGCRGAQGLAGQGSKEEGGDGGGEEPHFANWLKFLKNRDGEL